jgi:hypothetical protein
MKRNNCTLIKLLNQHFPAGVQETRKEKLRKIISILAENLIRLQNKENSYYDGLTT